MCVNAPARRNPRSFFDIGVVGHGAPSTLIRCVVASPDRVVPSSVGALCAVGGNGYVLIFENVSVFLKAPQVRLEQARCSFGLLSIHPGSPQTDYEALLLLYDVPPLGDEFLSAKIGVVRSLLGRDQ